MKSKIQKILSIPITILIKKILKLPLKPILNQFNCRREKQHLSTYLNNDFTELPNYFEIGIEEFIQENTCVSLEKIDDILAHKFNLLGSGTRVISYDANYDGFLRNNYSSPKYIKNEDELLKLLPEVHLNKSTQIRSLISNDYQPIDWWVDFRSGYRWNCDYYNQIRYGNIEGTDIKVPWELARLQHLFELSVSYPFVDKDLQEKIKTEIENQILDFISMNPPYYGPNWVSPMEVSIRSLNIIFTLVHLKNSGVIFSQKKFQYTINYLYTSYQFLLLHNEWNEGLRNNHYFANLLGMGVLSKFLYGKKRVSFHQTILKKFKKEIKVQFFEDGGNFEGSIPYHFFTFEIVYWLFYLFKDNLIDDKEFKHKLYKILEFNQTFKDITLKNVQIGDNDSGKILSLKVLNNFYYNFNTLSNILCNLLDINILNDNIKIFNDFGLISIRKNNLSIFISTGRKAQFGKGGHNHNDSQSFILFIDDVPIFVDPGTFVYTASPVYRNKYRSAIYHNKLTKSVDNEFEKELDSLFWFYDRKLEFIDKSNNEETIIQFIDKNSIFNRRFLFTNKDFIIKDFVNKYQVNLVSNFHLHPVCEFEMISTNELKIVSNHIVVSFHSSLNFILEDYNYSPEYGVIVPAKKIVIPIKNHSSKIIEYSIKYIK